MTVNSRICQSATDALTSGCFETNSRSSVGTTISTGYHDRPAKTHFSSNDRCHTPTRPTIVADHGQLLGGEERHIRLEDTTTRRQRGSTGVRQKTFRPSSGRLSSHIPPSMRSRPGHKHYAGARFCSDAPLASSLPRPPTHWLTLV